jgi:DNA-binding LacI/PurR family transcriptional regulator
MGPSHLSCARERLTGYRAELRQAAIEYDADLIHECDWRGGALDGPVEKLWGVPDPPTAVFTYNDLLAFECIAHLKKRGMRVPEDVAVVGHDDTDFATLSNPPLTTVAQDGSELGRRSVELLLMREQGRASATPAHVVLEPHLVVRESCGNRPGSRPASAHSEVCAPCLGCAEQVPE